MEHLAVFQIGNHICLFDFVAAGFPARVLAGDFPTLEQVQGGGFADVANAIQLIPVSYTHLDVYKRQGLFIFCQII